MIIASFLVYLVDYEIFLPDDKNVTESNFYLQKFCINFGACKRTKNQISPKKSMSNACPKAEQYVYIFQTHTFIGKHEELDEKGLFV